MEFSCPARVLVVWTLLLRFCNPWGVFAVDLEAINVFGLDIKAAGQTWFQLSQESFPDARSLEYLDRSVELGNPYGQHLRALMYAVGFQASTPNIAKSILHDHFSMAAGHPQAAMTFGYRALYGHGAPQSCVNALNYYRHAATLVVETLADDYTFLQSVPYHPRLPELSKEDEVNDFNKLIFLASASLKSNNGAYVFRIAKLLLQQPEPHYTLVNQLLLKAAAWGHVKANAYLGIMFAKGWGVTLNATKAREYFIKAPEDGDALYGLGLLFKYGRDIVQDHHAALEYFYAASKLGHVDAVYEAATLMTSLHQAKRYFEAASNSGHAMATFRLAELVEQAPDDSSCSKAIDMYKRVAERMDHPLLRLAWSNYVARNYVDAYWLYRLVAEEGFEVAHTNAAWLLQLYVSQPSDTTRKMLLYRAAHQGSGYAQLELAHAHYSNSNFDLAIRAYSHLTSEPKFRSSKAYMHIAPAYFYLGYMHEMGYGVPCDRSKALDLYIQASAIERRFKWPIDVWKWKWWLQDLWAHWLALLCQLACQA
ncbi:hypothetical protein AeMF1_000842 [Aphanomyces euteiches]|nr:hypothetical protein AeMF1_000842 [Aphanomyces euteiches]